MVNGAALFAIPRVINDQHLGRRRCGSRLVRKQRQALGIDRLGVLDGVREEKLQPLDRGRLGITAASVRFLGRWVHMA
jgi:hypothetical protein